MAYLFAGLREVKASSEDALRLRQRIFRVWEGRSEHANSRNHGSREGELGSTQTGTGQASEL